MAASTRWQLALDSAQRYEAVLVPSILGPAARALVDRAAPEPGTLVLDAGCGTGAVARYAAEQVGASGRVIGIDLSPGMVAVARSLPCRLPTIPEWRQESLLDLALPDDCVDVVLCSQTLQFVPDRARATSEMRRVLKPGGRLGLGLWCELPRNPYFHALVSSIQTHLGEQTAAGLGAAFSLSEEGAIRPLLGEAGFHETDWNTKTLELDLPPASTFVPDHIRATPMQAGFDGAPPEARKAVVDDVAASIAPFARRTGMRIPFLTHLVVAQKT